VSILLFLQVRHLWIWEDLLNQYAGDMVSYCKSGRILPWRKARHDQGGITFERHTDQQLGMRAT